MSITGLEAGANLWKGAMENNYERVGSSTKQRQLTKEGMNQIIYQILSSDQGLASLASGENLSGGYASTAKAQLAQDLTIKIAGELANLTAPEVTTTSDIKSTKEGRVLSKVGDFGDKYNADHGNLGGIESIKDRTVICTELNRQGLLSNELYFHKNASTHFRSLSPCTISGYHSWANKVVPRLSKSPKLSKLIAPIAIKRYEMVVTKRFNFLGAITIYIGQPLCFIIGLLIRGSNVECPQHP